MRGTRRCARTRRSSTLVITAISAPATPKWRLYVDAGSTDNVSSRSSCGSPLEMPTRPAGDVATGGTGRAGAAKLINVAPYVSKTSVNEGARGLHARPREHWAERIPELSLETALS